MKQADYYRFTGAALEPVTSSEPAESGLLAADSWLVEDGRVRGFERHLERFGDWVVETDEAVGRQLPEFTDAVRRAIPLAGRWFPRIELHRELAGGSAALYLRLREAPAKLDTVTLWTYPEADPRQRPTYKGPDLSLGMQLRRNAQMHGADEAVLLSAEGFVVEGALSSLVWWRGDTLFVPKSDLAQLQSITREQVEAIAAQTGLSVREDSARPADLVGLEIWSLSSLQGIRPVTEWVDLGGPVGHPLHLEMFTKRLRMLETAIR